MHLATIECLVDAYENNPVRFLGPLNLPPHIKNRMRQLRWDSCLLHLAPFLALATTGFFDGLEADAAYRALSKPEAMQYITRVADKPRLEELGFALHALERWADVSYGLQSMATEYEPSGQVACIDVYRRVPLYSSQGGRGIARGMHAQSSESMGRLFARAATFAEC